VRAAVTKGQDVSPALEAPAHRLAAQILADRFRTMRISRRAGWIQLVGGAAYGVTGIILIIMSSRSSLQTDGVTAVVDSGLLIFAGAYFALRQPHRIRQNAEQTLRG
jgi:hypothetical protein